MTAAPTLSRLPTRYHGAVAPAVEVLLFDLGGVLVDFSGVEDLIPLLPTGAPADEVKARWVACPTSNAFGTGQLGAADFARRFTESWEISMEPDAFLREWRTWTRGWLPGATELLDSLRPRYRLAALSNCNEVHWDVLCGELGLLDHLDLAISSHQVGTRKPDPTIYRHALAKLGVAADRVLFFDDARGNVEAAQALGMRAHVTDGPAAVRRALVADGLIPA
jgi:putative hydrolase of the HAD superfamily